jgi:5-methylcytosine-specific restriction endonuclease McrA
MRYICIPFKKVPLTKHNIFRRDGHKCGYCGSKRELTLDHILPKSRGGGNTWKNLITCCKTCNGKKNDMTPSEASMELLVTPYAPTMIQFIDKINNDPRSSWSKYLK